MQAVINLLDGKKTYLLSIAIIAYAVLAYFGVAPEPDKVQAAMVIISGYALTFRSTLSKFLADFK